MVIKEIDGNVDQISINYKGSTYVDDGVVYRGVNKVTGKMYIGKTEKNPISRIRSHQSSPFFSKDFDNWDWDILVRCYRIEGKDLDFLRWIESFFIMYYQSLWPNGWNLNFGYLFDDEYEEAKGYIKTFRRFDSNVIFPCKLTIHSANNLYVGKGKHRRCEKFIDPSCIKWVKYICCEDGNCYAHEKEKLIEKLVNESDEPYNPIENIEEYLEEAAFKKRENEYTWAERQRTIIEKDLLFQEILQNQDQKKFSLAKNRLNQIRKIEEELEKLNKKNHFKKRSDRDREQKECYKEAGKFNEKIKDLEIKKVILLSEREIKEREGNKKEFNIIEKKIEKLEQKIMDCHRNREKIIKEDDDNEKDYISYQREVRELGKRIFVLKNGEKVKVKSLLKKEDDVISPKKNGCFQNLPSNYLVKTDLLKRNQAYCIRYILKDGSIIDESTGMKDLKAAKRTLKRRKEDIEKYYENCYVENRYPISMFSKIPAGSSI